MAASIDLTGQRFGRLVAVRSADRAPDGHRMWLCLCDCGQTCTVAGRNMRSGRTTSCGCFHRERLREQSLTHGMSGTPTYASWASMKSRCSNEKQQSFCRYGARGIRVCARWLSSFANFLEDMGERPAGMTLDRKNPFGNYEPDNCRWATPGEQNRNTRGQAALALLERMGVTI